MNDLERLAREWIDAPKGTRFGCAAVGGGFVQWAKKSQCSECIHKDKIIAERKRLGLDDMTNIVEWKDEELPPVGAVVELINNAVGSGVDEWDIGDRLECLAHRDAECGAVAVFWNINQKTANSLVLKNGEKVLYRKIKTDREKTIEAALDIVDLEMSYGHLIKRLYDLGMLKLPD